jgi:hypothetical protein
LQKGESGKRGRGGTRPPPPPPPPNIVRTHPNGFDLLQTTKAEKPAAV